MRRFVSKRNNGSSVIRGEDLTAKHVYARAKKRLFPSTEQWRQLGNVLRPEEARALRIGFLLILLGVILTGSRFYFTHLSIVPAVGGEYTEGLVGQPQFVNPILAPGNTVDMDLTQLVFRGLFTRDTMGQLIPDIATSYELTDNETRYTIHLREDVLWHDGQVLDAQDVVFTFRAIADPAYKSPLRATFQDVAIEAVDDQTVTFTLKEPFGAFLSSLTVGLLPAHAWESVDPKRVTLTSLNIQPVGNGPYRFEKFTKDQFGTIRSYSLTRWRSFYGDAAHLKSIQFKFYPEISSAVDALENRNVEGLGFIPNDNLTAFETRRLVQLKHLRIPEEVLVFFNQDRQPILKDNDVRKALNMSMNREALIQRVYHGNAAPLFGPLPSQIDHDPPQVAFDPSQAVALLEEAGWNRPPEGGTRIKSSGDDVTPLHLEMATIDAPDMVALGNALVDLWGQAGVEIELKVVPPGEWTSSILSARSFDLLLGGILFGADLDPFPFWHSSQSTHPGVNLSQYRNKKVDTLLEEARITQDLDVRREKYLTFQSVLLEDLPALFIVEPLYTYATSSKLHGIDLEAVRVPSDRFRHVETWYTKTRKVFRPLQRSN